LDGFVILSLIFCCIQFYRLCKKNLSEQEEEVTADDDNMLVGHLIQRRHDHHAFVDVWCEKYLDTVQLKALQLMFPG
jgi:hypothetical protein